MSDVSLVDDYSDLYMHGREFGISKRKNGMSSAGGYSECSFESKWAMNNNNRRMDAFPATQKIRSAFVLRLLCQRVS